ncbi:MAG: hypothetical protein IJC69_02645 [Clostridia bacterium]|nr:hypothetical protein [Clostridia bacterium]
MQLILQNQKKACPHEWPRVLFRKSGAWQCQHRHFHRLHKAYPLLFCQSLRLCRCTLHGLFSF